MIQYCQGFKKLGSPFHFGIVVVQSLSHIQLSVMPWAVAHQASLSLSISQSSPRFISIDSVMPSNHLILCCPIDNLASSIKILRACDLLSNDSTFKIMLRYTYIVQKCMATVMFTVAWFMTSCMHAWVLSHVWLFLTPLL